MIEGIDNPEIGDYYSRFMDEYEKEFEIVMYYNDEVFQTEEYGADAIKKESKLAFLKAEYVWYNGG